MRAALDPNGADAYWAGRFGLIPLANSRARTNNARTTSANSPAKVVVFLASKSFNPINFISLFGLFQARM